MAKRNAGWTVVALLSAALLSGCEAGSPSVTGQVTLDGEPVEGAQVEFTPVEGGRPSSGTTDENGNYELRYTAAQAGAEPGKYKVRITAYETITDEYGAEQTGDSLIPPKYNEETELEREVKPGANTFDFELEST